MTKISQKRDFDTTGTGYSKSNNQLDEISSDTVIIQENSEKSKDYRKFSEIEEREIQWLWKPYIVKGNLNIIVGDGGVGKSYLTTWLVSAISKGDNMPFSDESFNAGNAILQNAEDDLNATVLPRLLKNNADVSRIGFFNEEDKGLTIQQIERLESVIKEINPEIVVLDPIQAYLGDVNMNSTGEVRSALKPLKQLAEKYGCAIVMLMHLNKNVGNNKATNRIMGSYDFVATCRSVLLVAQNPNNSEEKLFIPTKTNLMKENEKNSLSFKINENGKIEWLENKGKLDPDEILYENNYTVIDKKSYVKGFIIGALSRGDIYSNAFIEVALKNDISPKLFKEIRGEMAKERTIRNYQKDKGVYWTLLSSKKEEANNE